MRDFSSLGTPCWRSAPLRNQNLLSVGEPELFEVFQSQRRALIACADALPVIPFNNVMERVVSCVAAAAREPLAHGWGIFEVVTHFLPPSPSCAWPATIATLPSPSTVSRSCCPPARALRCLREPC